MTNEPGFSPYAPGDARNTPKPQLPPGVAMGVGLAVASLVLGIVSVCLTFFALGVGFGIVGLILGVVHLSKRLHFYKVMAIWGIVLCLIGTLAGAGFGVLFGIACYQGYKTARAAYDDVELALDPNVDTNMGKYVGTPTPDANLVDINGNRIVLSELKGKRVILDFWATWSGACRKEIPHFVKLTAETSPDELVIIGICSTEEEDLDEFTEKYGINYAIVATDDLPAPYDEIYESPTILFIDRNGIIQSALSGYHDYETLKKNALAEDYVSDPNAVPEAPRRRPRQTQYQNSAERMADLAVFAGGQNA